jgi:hypothetical protein
MKNNDSIGVQITQILLPKEGTDLHKWAVIACDQFTSEPDYWQQVEKIVAGNPSTLHLTLPEVYLGKTAEESRAASAQDTMKKYLSEGAFSTIDGLILVERNTGTGKTRYGLMMALDLEKYDFNKGSQSLIRATEGTIIERLPPRMKIREGAPLELPHILVLVDDPEGTVIEPVYSRRGTLKKVYDFELMLGSGHLTGYHVNNPKIESGVIDALERLAKPEGFCNKYGVGKEKSVLLFAIGDGNHSLATAKAIWEKIKPSVGMNHPARYALVEIENVHDVGLTFEPIHRALFGVKDNLFDELKTSFLGRYSYTRCSSDQQMISGVNNHSNPDSHLIGVISPGEMGIITINNPSSNLPVGSLQPFLDDWGKRSGFENIDYVHGENVILELGKKPGNVGFFLPPMNKSDLFKTVILDGVLPRKTFSMGEAKEKRFYMECKKITS